MLSSAAYLPVEIIPAKPNTGSGIGLKLFGFIPESCSRSSRSTVRNHPGIAFILSRNPHLVHVQDAPLAFIVLAKSGEQLFVAVDDI